MDNTELAGRIEAVSKFVLRLAAELETTGVLDGPVFCGQLRGPERMDDQVEYVRIARHRLDRMADWLDEARAVREALLASARPGGRGLQ
jgi:hypothetical protein